MDRLVARGQSTSLGPILLGSFVLTVLSFLLSTGISEVRAQGIANAAESIATNASPSIYQLSGGRRLTEALVADVEFNVRHASELASWIAVSRKQQRLVAVVLNGVSVLFAAIAAVAVFRVVRGYTEMMNTRLTDLEGFAGRVAHDIRSPLASVGLALEATRRKQVIDEATITMLDRAGRSMQRAAQVVDGLLVLARAGMHPEEGLRADVRAVAEDVIDELSLAAKAKGVELELEPMGSIEIACGPGVLVSILSNLIGNAIKYIGEGPLKQVRVSARDLGPRVRIEVLDTGPGVPAELRPRIFDPYVRAASSSIPGMGLGLATVRRVVEAHGGAVGVEPGKEGGSRFWVELPKALVDDGEAKHF